MFSSLIKAPTETQAWQINTANQEFASTAEILLFRYLLSHKKADKCVSYHFICMNLTSKINLSVSGKKSDII